LQKTEFLTTTQPSAKDGVLHLDEREPDTISALDTIAPYLDNRMLLVADKPSDVFAKRFTF